ncbi:MAG: murein biosynthesis integral membrane protein MurJ [Clostridiales bacterium]|jgi:murein biosynthesis integral membrane protein MurJ|nr:murein biosynthesis integral membrane protein MurJ [Clostridiales bacterium]
MQKKSGALRTVTIMMVITFAGKALGLLRDSFAGSYFGTATAEATAFNYAGVLPRGFMDVLFSSAISASFIPVFNEALERWGRQKAFKLAHNFISLIFIASAMVTIVFMALAEPILRLYDGGGNAGVVALSITPLRIMLLTIVLGCLAFSLTGVLQSLGEFNVPAAMGLVSNAVILIYFFFFMNRFGIIGLCAAFVTGWLAQFLIQIPFLVKNHFGFRFSLNLKDEGLKRIGLLMLPVMVSTWVTPVNLLINGKMAHLDIYADESFNGLTYANNLYSVLSGVFVLSVTNVVFPRLSVHAVNEDRQAFGETMSQTIRVMFFLLLPMTFGLIALSRPLVRLFYERGEFTALSTDLTSTALIYFSTGICGFGLHNILTRGFYAFQEGRTPMLTSVLAIAANLGLSWGLVKLLGIGGPALASSISISLAAVVMLWVMNRRVKGIVSRRLCVDLLKMLAIGLIMLLAVLRTRDFLSARLEDNIAGVIWIITLPAAAGTIIYMALARLARLPEALTAFGILGKFLKRR